MTNKPPFTRSEVEHHVTRYMLRQGWELADPQELAEKICETWSHGGQDQSAALNLLYAQISSVYAAVLHDHLTAGDPAHREAAQHEVKRQIERSTRIIGWDPAEREDLVSDIWVKLNRKLEREPLNSPQSLFSYIFQMLRNERIDRYRRKMASGPNTDATYLEELPYEPAVGVGKVAATDAQPLTSDPEPEIERTIMDEEARQRLRGFLQRHLDNENQFRIAVGFFLENLTAQRIADLLGTRPVYVRQAKARVLSRLKNLSPEARAELRAILDDLLHGEGGGG